MLNFSNHILEVICPESLNEQIFYTVTHGNCAYVKRLLGNYCLQKPELSLCGREETSYEVLC